MGHVNWNTPDAPIETSRATAWERKAKTSDRLFKHEAHLENAFFAASGEL